MSNSDFSPTLLGMLNISHNQKYHGKDRSSLLKGTEKDYWEVVFFIEGLLHEMQ